jgi:hypothetical protein
MNCQLCETAPAQVIKLEAERTWDDVEGAEVVTAVPTPVCLACVDLYYDGTEEYPGTQPLPAAEVYGCSGDAARWVLDNVGLN